MAGYGVQYSVRIVQNAEDADDIAQEVFIQVFQSIRSLKVMQVINLDLPDHDNKVAGS